MVAVQRLAVLLAVVAGVAVTMSGAPGADPAPAAVYFGAFRIVKAAPGEPSRPEITLPAEYGFVAGSQHQVASRAEYYSFVQGPRSGPITVSVRWPGVPVAAVISGKSRLALRHDPADESRVTFTVPVSATSANALQSTLQVFSYPSGSTAGGHYWRIEHNHPDRAAGYWTTVPWPANQTRTFLNHMVAVEAILRDSGLAAEAARRGHFFALMGFETNNLLHMDNPPHWHLSYYPGRDFSAPRAHVPHFWMDVQGVTFYNGMDIQGQGRSRFYAGDPAPIHDAQGTLIVTLTIRTDGGLDIDPPGGPRYSITADGRPDQDSPGGSFAREVQVYRDGQPWRWARASDDVKAGIVITEIGNLSPPAFRQTTTYRYDPLTGVIHSITRT